MSRSVLEWGATIFFNTDEMIVLSVRTWFELPLERSSHQRFCALTLGLSFLAHYSVGPLYGVKRHGVRPPFFLNKELLSDFTGSWPKANRSHLTEWPSISISLY